MNCRKRACKYVLAILLAMVCCVPIYSQQIKGFSNTARLSDVLVGATPKPTSPPKLVVEDITFKDADSDNIISSEEEAIISFTIKNNGTGTAYHVKPTVVELSQIRQVNIEGSIDIPILPVGGSREVKIVLKGNTITKESDMNLEVSAIDGNGFFAQSQCVSVSAQPAKLPQLLIADYKLSSELGGRPQTGELIHLQMIVQNVGEGIADNVKLNIGLPTDVFPGDSLRFSVGRLRPGDQRIYDFPFFTNNRYNKSSVDININLDEKSGRFQTKKLISLDLNNSLVAVAPIAIQGQKVVYDKIELASLHSDVDINIPEQNKKQENLFALIIGNENYSNVGQIDVPFAKADALTFANYAEKTLGVPKGNITTITNATKAILEVELHRISRIASTYSGNNKKPRIIFYYAGHGFYNSNKESVIMPVDVAATVPQMALKLSDVYKTLSNSGAERVTVFLDACFSGGSRNGSLVAARGIRIEPNKDAITGNVVVMAATGGDQSALPYQAKQHGMFTYFLLKELQISKGEIEYGELFNNLKSSVQHNSIKVNKMEQLPEALLSVGLTDEWQTWKLTE